MSITGPEPVSLDEAKRSARVDGDELNADIQRLIASARQMAEHLTGRVYVQSLWRESLADWPGEDQVIHLDSPSTCTISYWTAGGWTELPASAFSFGQHVSGRGTIVVPSAGGTWPVLGALAVGLPRVRINLGAGDDGVSPNVKDFILAHVAAWVNNPDALVTQQLQVNPLLHSLLDAERLWH